jgi:hypothetical protein
VWNNKVEPEKSSLDPSPAQDGEEIPRSLSSDLDPEDPFSFDPATPVYQVSNSTCSPSIKQHKQAAQFHLIRIIYTI